MAKYRKISPKIWNDEKFRSLSDNGKLVFFMLLTHPNTSAIGTIRAYIQGLAAELKWSEKAFREAFQEALNKGMVKASEKDGLIWLPHFMRYNSPESPNVLRSWSSSLDDCPECSLKNEVYISVKVFAEGLREGFRKAFNEAFRHPSPNQEQEQEQEQEQNNNPPNPLSGELCLSEKNQIETKPKKSSRKVGIEYSESFLSFWDAYPNRVGKDKAYQAWKKVKERHPDAKATEIIEAIRQQSAQNHFRGSDGQDYIPHPATWLNQGRWGDEIRTREKNGAIMAQHHGKMTMTQVIDANAEISRKILEKYKNGQ